MAKVPFTNLKLKVNSETKTITYNDIDIEIRQYLPVSDKYDLVMVALQRSEEDGIYNPIRFDMFFHLNLVYMYTNLSFTDKQKESEEKLYDALESNGLIDTIANNIEEYQLLVDYAQDIMDRNMEYKNSAAAVLQSVVNDLPKNAQAAMDIVNSFDKDKYKAVVEFATHANADRPIK